MVRQKLADSAVAGHPPRSITRRGEDYKVLRVRTFGQCPYLPSIMSHTPHKPCSENSRRVAFASDSRLIVGDPLTVERVTDLTSIFQWTLLQPCKQTGVIAAQARVQHPQGTHHIIGTHKRAAMAKPHPDL